MRFLAIQDETGRELQYEGYARQRAPELGEWEIVQFPRYTGDPVRIISVWVCESATSDYDDGESVPFQQPIIVKDGELINIHVRGV